MISNSEHREQESDLIFALDIGTRSVIGVVGKLAGERFKVMAIEKEEHGKRAMLDGQIDNIDQVAALARAVTLRLEAKTGVCLKRVCVAAAGRALHSERGSFQLELPQSQFIGDEQIRQLEMGAVSAAEKALQEADCAHKQFFLVGYTVSQYCLDRYPMTTLRGHNGQLLEAEVVATFLPSEVVESLYSAMRAAQLQVVNMTLEPIAAMNAVIPPDLRLLNLALVDIGAGTSDIAICRDGSIVGYTMVTLAGDEITEAIMRAFLVDFKTAEQIKSDLNEMEEVCFTDILGLEQVLPASVLYSAIEAPLRLMSDEISRQILEVNGGPPSALFLAGGGSKLKGLSERFSECLEIDRKRVAVAGNNFDKSAYSEEYNLIDPEYATPLGIAVSAGLGLTNDSYVVELNGNQAKLFRNGLLTLQEVLFMNGYSSSDLIGKSGPNLVITLDGRRLVFRGEPAAPAILRVNGEDVTANTVIHAGDVIDFIPAKHGATACRTLADLLGADFSGNALVNNQPAELDRNLCPGDVILTLSPPSPSHMHTKEAPPAPPPERPVPPAPPLAPERPVSLERPVVSEPNPVVRTAAAPPPQTGKSISIILNDAPMVLKPKEDGTPHYLMDLLQYSGIDFKHLDRPVLLLVNGRESFFRQILKDQDTVVIQCKESD